MDKENINSTKKTADRRVEKTIRSIRTAFLSLIMEKEPSMITVKEIAQRADINRKTFYMYFSNIDEIIEDTQKTMSQKFLQIFTDALAADKPFDAYALFEKLNNLISEDIELYRRLNKTGMLALLIIHVKNGVVAHVMNEYHLSDEKNSRLYELCAEYIASGVLSMYARWFSMESSITLDELTKTAGELTVYGIKSILPKIGSGE